MSGPEIYRPRVAIKEALFYLNEEFLIKQNSTFMAQTARDYKAFIAETNVDDIVAEIEQTLAARNGGKRETYSDLVKEEDGRVYEYVNYVQEGGGMLGIALVGYTYVLEKMGFRFLKLAGTSAGAINTMMLAAVDKKNYPAVKGFTLQSQVILQEMLDFDLWKLVDGHWFAKWLIKVFINNPFGKTLLKWLVIASLAIPTLYAIYTVILPILITQSTFFSGAFHTVDSVFKIIAAIAIILLILIAVLIFYFRYRFARAGYGINPGRNFHAWMDDILKRNGIDNAIDLDRAMQHRTENLSLRPERVAQNLEGDHTQVESPFLTIVASDITTQTKVEFPLMAKDYWSDPGQVNPADFVRASMAIPVFFEPFKVEVNKKVQQRSALQKRNAMAADKKTDTKTISFVDGGILSNFPINVFHNPTIKVARMPTFGVKLEDEDHIMPGEENKSKPKLSTYLGNVFSTIRFYYDRDFLKRNEVYETSIAHVDVAGFNWLNFGMDYKTQQKLFVQGAEAARTFFLGGEIWVDGIKKSFEPYDWETFKQKRAAIITETKK